MAEKTVLSRHEGWAHDLSGHDESGRPSSHAGLFAESRPYRDFIRASASDL
jgi:hypothetical protein